MHIYGPDEYTLDQEKIIEQSEREAINDLDCARQHAVDEIVGSLSDIEISTLVAALVCDPKSGHHSAISARGKARDLRAVLRERYTAMERDEAIENLGRKESDD